MKTLDDGNDDNTYDDNISTSSAELSASMSTGCFAPTGCGGREGHQILTGAGNILNKEEWRFEKGELQYGGWACC
jgi:Na+-transporting NADH:ubiquinone oxidoreductase subunit NqrF